MRKDKHMVKEERRKIGGSAHSCETEPSLCFVDYLHQAIFSTSDHEHSIMRDSNTRNPTEVRVPLRQHVACAAAPYVSFARGRTRKDEVVGRIGAHAEDGLRGSAASGGLLLSPIIQVHMRLVAVLQNEPKCRLSNAGGAQDRVFAGKIIHDGGPTAAVHDCRRA